MSDQRRNIIPSHGEDSWSSIVSMGGIFIIEWSDATELGDVIGKPCASSCCARAWLGALTSTLIGCVSDIFHNQQQRTLLSWDEYPKRGELEESKPTFLIRVQHAELEVVTTKHQRRSETVNIAYYTVI